MSPWQLVATALAALLTHPWRFGVTLLGIVIGTASVLLVRATGDALDRYIATTLADVGPHAFLLSAREVPSWMTDRGPRLTRRDADWLREHLVHASEVACEVADWRPIRGGGRTLSGLELWGCEPRIADTSTWRIERGRMFTTVEDGNASNVCIVGPDVSEFLFPGEDPIGRTIRVSERSFRIVGVTAARGSVFGYSRDAFVRIPLKSYERLFGETRALRIAVQVHDDVPLERAIDAARSTLRGRRHLGPGVPDDFQVATAEGVRALWSTVTENLSLAALGIVAVSLIVGGIVLGNVLLVEVIERAHEIALRRALGATGAAIGGQFLIESVVLAALGGVVGFLVAILGSHAVARFTPLEPVVPLIGLAQAVTLCAGLGLVFGAVPALLASRRDPARLLGHDLGG